MKVEQLGYFIKLAEELNFTTVAKELFMTQPTLSRNIASLEQEMNMTLFIRDRGKVQLTAEGEFAYKCLKPAYDNLIEKLDYVKENNEIVTEINIGVQEEQIMNNALAETIYLLQIANPKVKVNICREPLDRLVDDLLTEKFDIINVLDIPDLFVDETSLGRIPLETESSYMAISAELEPDLPDVITTEEFREYVDKYPVILTELIRRVGPEKQVSLLAKNFNVPRESIKNVKSMNAISVPIFITTKMGLTVCNRTHMLWNDPNVKIAEIKDSVPYIKSVYYNRYSKGKNTRRFIEILKRRIEKE